ncbi:MAG: DNA polymerase III subunit epsilon [Alphaproteobacteria bacterium]
MEREIVLDTETTGLDPFKGHRVVEIGCVELVNCLPTGREFHCYLNPERAMAPEAFAVHGLSTEFLAQFQTFSQRVHEFLEFIKGGRLVIHNASFDLKFLNAELSWLGLESLSNPVADTLSIARKKFPGSPANLDALCRRFGVDHKSRDKHGALLDAQLLAQVYLELQGGRQPTLGFEDTHQGVSLEGDSPGMGHAGMREAELQAATRPVRPIRFFPISPDVVTLHHALLKALGAPLWQLPSEAISVVLPEQGIRREA